MIAMLICFDLSNTVTTKFYQFSTNTELDENLNLSNIKTSHLFNRR